MSKTEIIEKLAAEVSLPKTKVKEVLDAFVKVLNEGLSTNGKVSLSGLGNFSKTVRAAQAETRRPGRRSRSPRRSG